MKSQIHLQRKRAPLDFCLQNPGTQSTRVMPIKERERNRNPINEGHNRRQVYDSEKPTVSPKDWPVKNPPKPPKK